MYPFLGYLLPSNCKNRIKNNSWFLLYGMCPPKERHLKLTVVKMLLAWGRLIERYCITFMPTWFHATDDICWLVHFRMTAKKCPALCFIFSTTTEVNYRSWESVWISPTSQPHNIAELNRIWVLSSYSRWTSAFLGGLRSEIGSVSAVPHKIILSAKLKFSCS